MQSSLNLTDIAALTATATAMVTSTMQWVKQFAWWKNDWCRVASPLVGLATTFGWLVANGGVNGSHVDPILLYQSLVTGFCAGITALVAYEAQRSIRILSPGPDNHPADMKL